LQLHTTCIKPLCRDRQMQQLQWRIQIDPKEEEKLMGIKRKVATTGHPYVGERSMKTWCHEVGRMVLWVPVESLLLPWSFTQHGTAKCGSKSPNRRKTHTSPKTSVCNQIARINLAPRRIWGWECSLLGWTKVQIVFGLKLRQPCLSFWISKNMVAQLIEWLRRRCMDTGSRGGRKHVLLQIAPPLWKQSLKGL
jgi:hypothetical protein